MRPQCPENCRLKCWSKVSQEMRQNNFKKFYSTKNYDDKVQIISHLMIVENKNSSREPGIRNRRMNTCKYFLHIDVNNEKTRVCKTMFLNTFGFSNGFTSTASRNLKKGACFEKDKRGKHKNRGNKVHPLTIQSVLDHLNLFEMAPAHYVRKDSKKDI